MCSFKYAIFKYHRMIQENVQEAPLCCEAGGEIKPMIENAIYRNQTSGTYINDKW